MATSLTWLGHGAWQLETAGQRVLIDPFLTGNPAAAVSAESVAADFILIMTFGGPNHATYVSGLAIFEKAYMYLRFGTATAMAWILAALLIGFTVLQMKRLSRMEFRTAKN